MTDRLTYAKLAIYVSRGLHFQLKFASIGEHRSLSDFAEELLRDAMLRRVGKAGRTREGVDDDTG